jgi:hypothetical protein
MSRMLRHVSVAEPFVEVVPAAAIASDTATVRELDITHMSAGEQDIVAAPFCVTLSGGTTSGASGVSGGVGSAAAAGSVRVHALVVWFDIRFDDTPYDPARAAARAAAGGGSAPVAAGGNSGDGSSQAVQAREGAGAGAFSTGPFTTPTHWQQTALALATPIDVPAGSLLDGRLSMVRDAVNPREYRFVLEGRVTAPGCLTAAAGPLDDSAGAASSVGGASVVLATLRQSWHMAA